MVVFPFVSVPDSAQWFRRLAASLHPAAVGVVTMVLAMGVARSVADPDEPSMVSLLALGGIGLVAYVVPVWLLDRRRLRAVAALMRGAA